MWNHKIHGLLSSSFATTTATALLPTATSYPLIFIISKAAQLLLIQSTIKSPTVFY